MTGPHSWKAPWNLGGLRKELPGRRQEPCRSDLKKWSHWRVSSRRVGRWSDRRSKAFSPGSGAAAVASRRQESPPFVLQQSLYL